MLLSGMYQEDVFGGRSRSSGSSQLGVPYLVNTCFEVSPGFDAPAPILIGFVGGGLWCNEIGIGASGVLVTVEFVVCVRRCRGCRVFVAAPLAANFLADVWRLAEALSLQSWQVQVELLPRGNFRLPGP